MTEKIIISSDTKKSQRIPPGQYETKKWPVLHAGNIPAVNTQNWRFDIFGLVKVKKSLNFEEFMSLDKVKVISDIHCVTTWSRLDNEWRGISSSTILSQVQLLPEAKYVLVHAENGFTTNIPLEDFMEEDVLFAFEHNNLSITSEHGGPIRLVVPKLYFWKSAKWVTGIEFLAADNPGYWEAGGYHMHGDPWTEERYR